MDLLCTEQELPSPLTAYQDPIFLDDAALEQLLHSEEKYQASTTYFQRIQHDLQPFMRNMVATWMAEVCEEEKCESEVFALALNYLDRVLCVIPIDRGQLQLFACASLFLASKLRDTRPLNAERLAQYTEHSVTAHNILDCELVLASRLRWDVAAVTAPDFLDLLLSRLPVNQDFRNKLRMCAHSYISLVLPDFSMSAFAPSVIAVAALQTATCAMLGSVWCRQHALLPTLSALVHSDTVWIRSCMEQLEQIVIQQTQNAETPKCEAALQTVVPVITPGAPSTPTDVQDIHF